MHLDSLLEIADPLVLMRGQQYHREGRVAALEQTGHNAWSAEVQGTEPYEVELAWDTEGELTCACTCPYDRGPICKHVVAVLLAVAEAYPDSPIKEIMQISPPASGQVRTILESLSRETLVEILVGLAEDDPETSFDLRTRYGEGALDKVAALTLAREAVRLGRDRDGFIDYWGTSRAAHGLDSLLSRAGRLTREGRAAEAVPIAQAVLETAARAYGDADDSMGLLGDCVATAIKQLQESGDQLDELGRRDLLSYCLALAPEEPYRGFDWGWELAQLAADLIAQPDERSRVFKQVDSMAEHYTGEGAGLPTSAVEYDRETAAQIKLSVVERQDGPEAALRFLRDHIHLHPFRQRLIQHHWGRGELADVKRLCVDWLQEHTAGEPAHLRYYLDVLLGVARREEDTPEILRLARELMLISGEFEYYAVIKQAIPGRSWPETLGALIQDLEPTSRGWVVLPEIYVHEEMWDKLLKAALRAGEALLERYRDELEPRFPEQVSMAYEGTVYEMLERTSNRAVYAQAADYLRRMTAMGYEGRVGEIIDDLTSSHRNRRAMVAELNAARPHG